VTIDAGGSDRYERAARRTPRSPAWRSVRTPSSRRCSGIPAGLGALLIVAGAVVGLPALAIMDLSVLKALSGGSRRSRWCSRASSSSASACPSEAAR